MKKFDAWTIVNYFFCIVFSYLMVFHWKHINTS